MPDPSSSFDPSRRSFLQKSGAVLAGSTLPLSSFGEGNAENRVDIQLPFMLKEGDTIGVVAPGGPALNQQATKEFIDSMLELGLKVKLGQTIGSTFHYFSASDEARAHDINAMFADPDVKAIIAIRGGWGSARLLHMIDYQAIVSNPKPIMGFSDITSLLLAITSQTGMITFHGPVGFSEWDSYSKRVFRRTLMRSGSLKLNESVFSSYKTHTITTGKAQGRLLGGNLTVLSAIMGSGYVPKWDNYILFLEEINEAVYRVDRMLTQLRLSGLLTNASAVVFGQFTDCNQEDHEMDFTIEEVLTMHTKPLGIPCYYGARFGHIPGQFIIPIGALAEVDAGKGQISIKDSFLLER